MPQSMEGACPAAELWPGSGLQRQEKAADLARTAANTLRTNHAAPATAEGCNLVLDVLDLLDLGLVLDLVDRDRAEVADLRLVVLLEPEACGSWHRH